MLYHKIRYVQYVINPVMYYHFVEILVVLVVYHITPPLENPLDDPAVSKRHFLGSIFVTPERIEKPTNMDR